MGNDVVEEIKRNSTDGGANALEQIPDLPQEVSSFLGNLALLRGVPYHYLVPDEKYLPKKMTVKGKMNMEEGSLKVFMLDKEWVKCLLDGALSFTDLLDRRHLLNLSMAGNFIAGVYYNEASEFIKKQMYGMYAPGEHEKEMNERLETRKAIVFKDGHYMPTIAQQTYTYTGFLLRSSLVSSAPGMEVVANGCDLADEVKDITKHRPLQVIRLERISGDTLFCLCEGFIGNIEIKQPPEAVHMKLPDGKDRFRRAFLNTQDGAPLLDGVINIEKMVAGRPEDKKNAAALAYDLYAKPLKIVLRMKWEGKKYTHE